eukprot:TRINITY_DN22893_c0_g1_i1.p1 TRINITY_DN22893_c0_g1~~TRINITY_DN22893_c0_g1_i1.p1  ORF type:complete len:577 (-),score=63.77 TRINITY_DN22893_c0_g1_i1:358-2088(-)
MASPPTKVLGAHSSNLNSRRPSSRMRTSPHVVKGGSDAASAAVPSRSAAANVADGSAADASSRAVNHVTAMYTSPPCAKAVAMHASPGSNPVTGTEHRNPVGPTGGVVAPHGSRRAGAAHVAAATRSRSAGTPGQRRVVNHARSGQAGHGSDGYGSRSALREQCGQAVEGRSASVGTPAAKFSRQSHLGGRSPPSGPSTDPNAKRAPWRGGGVNSAKHGYGVAEGNFGAQNGAARGAGSPRVCSVSACTRSGKEKPKSGSMLQPHHKATTPVSEKCQNDVLVPRVLQPTEITSDSTSAVLAPDSSDMLVSDAVPSLHAEPHNQRTDILASSKAEITHNSGPLDTNVNASAAQFEPTEDQSEIQTASAKCNPLRASVVGASQEAAVAQECIDDRTTQRNGVWEVFTVKRGWAALAPALQPALDEAMGARSSADQVDILVDPVARAWVPNPMAVDEIVRHRCVAYAAFPSDRKMGKVGGEPPRPIRWSANDKVHCEIEHDDAAADACCVDRPLHVDNEPVLEDSNQADADQEENDEIPDPLMFTATPADGFVIHSSVFERLQQGGLERYAGHRYAGQS